MPRKPESPPPHEPGKPPRPQFKSHAARNAWNKLSAELYEACRIWQDDGPLLLELIQARADQYQATGERKEQGRKRAAEI